MKILITGAAGFIGHHLLEHILRNTAWEVICLVRMSRAGDLNRIQEVKQSFKDFDERVRIVRHDLNDPLDSVHKHIGEVDYIAHLAADSHVDFSIKEPISVFLNNCESSARILDYARKYQPDLRKFLYYSTDEVFGPSDGYYFKEDDRHNPKNPYAASKSAGEQLAISFVNTYKMPIVITHTMNNFGERQDPEKFIPMTIKRALTGELVNIHAYPDLSKAGARSYIHARNAADATLHVLTHGIPGEKYNIVGEKEVDNLKLALFIAEIVGKPLKYQMVNFHESRPGHDLLYRLDGRKMKELGWAVPVTFEDSLRKTVEWTLENRRWLK